MQRQQQTEQQANEARREGQRLTVRLDEIQRHLNDRALRSEHNELQVTYNR